MSVERLFQRFDFVTPLHQKLEQGNDSALKLRPLRTRDGVWAEGLPYDVFTDVRGNEEGYARPQSISFLEHLIQADDNDASKEQLQAAARR